MATAKKPADRKPASTKKKAAAKKVAGKPSTRAQPKSPVAQAPLEVTAAAQWKKPSGGVAVELPSGNVCLAQAVPMQKMLGMDIIPNELMGVVSRALEQGESDIDGSELLGALKGDGDTMDAVKKAQRMVDQAVLRIVVEPKVLDNLVKVEDNGGVGWRPLDETELAENRARFGEVLYIDDVDELDKMYLFQWAVGGSPDIANFR